jgi:hypothetical protein
MEVLQQLPITFAIMTSHQDLCGFACLFWRQYPSNADLSPRREICWTTGRSLGKDVGCGEVRRCLGPKVVRMIVWWGYQRRRNRRKKGMYSEQDKVVDSKFDIEIEKRYVKMENDNPSAARRRDPKPRLMHST